MENEKLDKKSKLNLFITFIVCVIVAIGSFLLGIQYSKRDLTNNVISCSYAVDNQATLTDAIADGDVWSLDIGCPVSWDTNSNDIFPFHIRYLNVAVFDLQGSYQLNISSRFWVYYYAYGSKSYFDFYNTNYQNVGSTESISTVIYSTLEDNYDIFLNTTFYSHQRTNTNNGFLSKTCALWYSKTTGGIGSIIGFDYGVQNLSDADSKPWYIPSGWGVTTNANLDVFVVSMFDEDGNRVTFSMLTDLTGLSTYWHRCYYYQGFGDSYEQGYNNGFDAGRNQGSQDGYEDGYSAGQNVGYSAGYSAGILDANDYSFLGLIGAVVDAPIQAFSGLFNFTVFGVNMAQFLLSLFSISLIIVIVRFVLFKKE